MGFPIAVGTKSVSSCSISLPEPLEDCADDGTVLVPAVIGGDDPIEQSCVFVACNSQELQALVTLSYYDMLRLDNGDCEYTVAELRITLSPLHQPFSTSYRESLHRVRLPCTNEQECTRRISKHQSPIVTPSSGQEPSLITPPTALFSSDQQFLTCMIPHTPPAWQCQKQRWKQNITSDSSVITFQLQLPSLESHGTRQTPVFLPSYIQTTNEELSSFSKVPVATNPRILKLSSFNVVVEEDENNDANNALLDVCAICDIAAMPGDDTSSRPSFLVVGLRNGNIMAVSHRPLRVAGLLYERRNTNNADEKFIVFMDHLTEWDNDEGSTIGRLVVIFNDGLASVFRSELILDNNNKEGNFEDNDDHQPPISHLPNEPDSSSSKDYRRSVSMLSRLSNESRLAKGYILIHLTETHKIHLPKNNVDAININSGLRQRLYVTAQWISSLYLAVAYQPKSDIISVEVLGLYDHGNFSLVCTMESSIDQLVENAHTTYSVDDDHCLNRDDERPPSNLRQSPRSHAVNRRQLRRLLLNYDSATDCIAISGHLCLSGRVEELFHFACVWNWRVNTQGLTIVPSRDYGSITTGSTNTPIQMSSFCFANNNYMGRKIVHIFSWATSSGCIRIRKEVYSTGILSPSNDLSPRGGSIRQANSLFVSSKAVCYPWVTRTSTRENMEIEWRESMIPKSYITSCGVPRVSAIGRMIGRSVAVAASKGISILDCSDRVHMDSVMTPNPLSHKNFDQTEAVLSRLLKPSISNPRWYLFGNATDERSFRVIAMSWWEGSCINTTGLLHQLQCDDILVAVVEILTGEMRGFYLSCWSGRNLTLDGQLLVSSPDASQPLSQSTWGISIPPGFNPKSIDLLTQPDNKLLPRREHFSKRSATVLVTDNSYQTRFIVYNLQAVPSPTKVEISNKERRQYQIVACQIADDSIGSPADLFLASTSFVNILDKCTAHTEDTIDMDLFHAATIGIIRSHGGGLDAIAVSKNRLIAIGQVLPSVDGLRGSRRSDICRYWLADVVYNQQISLNGLQLDYFIWILQLTDGVLLNWSVPFASKKGDIHLLTRPVSSPVAKDSSSNYVHQKGVSLGVVHNAGSTSSWMQQSSNGTRSDFLVGHVPRSLFGCVIGISQSCKKLHRSLGEDFDKHLFRPDFLDHEVFSPGDFVLYPPAFLPALYSLFREFSSTTTSLDSNFDYVNSHVKRRLHSGVHHEASLLSLELLILRAVEKIAAMGSKEGSKTEQNMYVSLVDTVRKNTTYLQFASLFLKLGRQIEPSCFPFLFPLPPSSDGLSNGETIEYLFEVSLEHGSTSMAVTALPLFSNEDTTRAMCAAVFDYCLNELDAICDLDNAPLFNIPFEEKQAAGEIFRYALKFDMPEGEDVESDSEPEDSSALSRKDYSLFCGLPRILGLGTRAKKEENPIKVVSSVKVDNASRKILRSSKFLPNGRGRRHSSNRNSSSNGVIGIVSSYLISRIFECEANESDFCWRKIAAICSLLLDEMRSCSRLFSKAQFARILKRSSFLAVERHQSNHLVKFFKHHIVNCTGQLDPSSAGLILDVLLALLGCAPSDEDHDMYWLVLLSMIIGHASERFDDILEDEPNDNPLWTAYLNARFELSTHR